MKKINFIWAILFCTVAPMLFISCEKQQDASEAIQGTWFLNSIAYQQMEEYGEGNSGESFLEESEKFLFTSSGSIETYYFDNYDYKTMQYYYRIDGNRLYTDYVNDWAPETIQYFRIKRLTANEMFLLVEIKDEDYPEYSDSGYTVRYLLKFSR